MRRQCVLLWVMVVVLSSASGQDTTGNDICEAPMDGVDSKVRQAICAQNLALHDRLDDMENTIRELRLSDTMMKDTIRELRLSDTMMKDTIRELKQLITDHEKDGCLSGNVTSKYCKLGDPLESCWPDVKTVIFERPFSRKPQVSIGFTLLDVYERYNTRVKASTSGITTRGFTITLGPWAGTHLYVVRVNWMACI